MRFTLAVRYEPWRFGPFCNGCGKRVEDHLGQLWVYAMVSLDYTLCEKCGDLYAPEVMRELRKHYDNMSRQADGQKL